MPLNLEGPRPQEGSKESTREQDALRQAQEQIAGGRLDEAIRAIKSVSDPTCKALLWSDLSKEWSNLDLTENLDRARAELLVIEDVGCRNRAFAKLAGHQVAEGLVGEAEKSAVAIEDPTLRLPALFAIYQAHVEAGDNWWSPSGLVEQVNAAIRDLGDADAVDRARSQLALITAESNSNHSLEAAASIVSPELRTLAYLALADQAAGEHWGATRQDYLALARAAVAEVSDPTTRTRLEHRLTA